MTTQETYNGYKNRSTWLAVVHLDNINNKVYEEAQKIAQKHKEMVEYWEDIKKHDHTSYSYPFHQHKAIELSFTNLLRRTQIHTEQNYNRKEVDIEEVLKHFID